jgi:hypothetical protein
MAHYKKIPGVIKAEQYLVGKTIPEGMNITYPDIIFSRDGKLFYPSHTMEARDWLSIEKKEDGLYDAFPFAYYEVKSGERKPISECMELYNIYKEVFNIKDPQEYAYIKDPEGVTKKVKHTDWVVQDKVISNEEFQKNYELLED